MFGLFTVAELPISSRFVIEIQSQHGRLFRAVRQETYETESSQFLGAMKDEINLASIFGISLQATSDALSSAIVFPVDRLPGSDGVSSQQGMRFTDLSHMAARHSCPKR